MAPSERLRRYRGDSGTKLCSRHLFQIAGPSGQTLYDGICVPAFIQSVDYGLFRIAGIFRAILEVYKTKLLTAKERGLSQTCHIRHGDVGQVFATFKGIVFYDDRAVAAVCI